MKGFFKFLIVSIGLVLIGIALVLILLATQFQKTVITTTERSLGFIYQTKVTVGSASLEPSTLTLELRDVAIANPEPFKEGNAITFERVKVAFDGKTLLSAEPTINKILLDGGVVNLRHQAGAGTNLDRLDKNAARLKEAGAGSLPSGIRRKFQIKEFVSEAVVLNMSSNLVPVSSVGMELAPFMMTSLGTDKPISTSELCALFMRNLIRDGVTVSGVLKPIAENIRDRFEQEPPADEDPRPPGDASTTEQ